MISKKMLLPVFILVALVQLFVPAKMIWDREDILKTGTEYKFETAPVDPSAPFRGKYIILRYVENTVQVNNTDEWKRGDVVFAILTIDENGYAKIEAISKEKPSNKEKYLKTKVNYISENPANSLILDFPFDRFYMEESKAKPAEDLYMESQRNIDNKTYALVSIKDGDAVLKDVMIDDKSIKEIVKESQASGKG